MNIKKLEKISRVIRATCVKMAYESKHGHLKSALTCSKILIYIYTELIDIKLVKSKNINRDRFYMSKGHGVSALYATFAKIGLLKSNTSFGSSGAFLSKTDLGPPDKIIPFIFP